LSLTREQENVEDAEAIDCIVEVQVVEELKKPRPLDQINVNVQSGDDDEIFVLFTLSSARMR